MFQMQHHAAPPSATFGTHTTTSSGHGSGLPDMTTQMRSAALAGAWQDNCASEMLVDFEHEMDMSTLWAEVGMQNLVRDQPLQLEPMQQSLPHQMASTQGDLPYADSPFAPAPHMLHLTRPPTPRDLFLSRRTSIASPFRRGVIKRMDSRAVDNTPGQTQRRPEVHHGDGRMGAGGDGGAPEQRSLVEAAADRIAHFETLFRLCLQRGDA